MDKVEELIASIAAEGKLLVAFSGGVDSAVLAKLAYDALGKNAVAVTVDAETFPKSEFETAKNVAREIGIRHLIVKHSELENPKISSNTPERCYYCKKDLTKVLGNIAEGEGIKTIADGVTQSDLCEHRPGIRAANEAGFWHPLLSLKFTKDEVRRLAKNLNLSVSKKPSSACLSSRIPYGERITREKLRRIEAAEDFLRGIGFTQVRVRSHENIARIEVLPTEMKKIMPQKTRDMISKALKKIGYGYITIDIQGYRSGSMDEVLNK